jgi:hypothetical protein
LSTHVGWAEALGKQLAGDSDVWQRTRARGGRPFRVCGDDVQAKASRGAHAGARAKQAARAIVALELPEEDE